MADAAGILRLNQALYDAIEFGDIDLMGSLWSRGEAVVCIHPGARPVYGRGGVMRAWSVIMANADSLRFVITDERVSFVPAGPREPRMAYVTCTENMFAGDGFAGGTAVASTVFVREDDAWKIAMHHASPVIGEVE